MANTNNRRTEDMNTTKATLCRWCASPVEVTPADEERMDELLTQLDYWGEASLTEEEQALVHCGPVCEACKASA
jgi:hypothetical protein